MTLPATTNGERVRVLVVDDSAAMRRLLQSVLESDTGIEVIGTAPDGKVALQRIPKLDPDVVTLDIEMPEMDGLETLAEIRKLWPRLPVIMVSSQTERGAGITLDALRIGANDYVCKPQGDNATDELKRSLLPRVKVFGESRLRARGLFVGAAPTISQTGSSSPDRTPSGGVFLPPKVRVSGEHTISLVVVGTSTGGPNALVDFLKPIAQRLTVPMLIVQHMPAVFTRLLADRLTALSGIPITEAVNGTTLVAGHGYVAPGDFHLEVGTVGASLVSRITLGVPENHCRPSVDVTFRSAAAACRAGVLGVVLTGMGQDGVGGCQAIIDSGGDVCVQDEASAVVWGMPGAVAKAGLAYTVAPPPRLGEIVAARINRVGAHMPKLK